MNARLATIIVLLSVGCSKAHVGSDRPPVAFAGYDETFTLARDTTSGELIPVRCLLDGRRSFDPDDPAARLSFHWRQVAGPIPATTLEPGAALQELELTEPGLYVFSLRVTSNGLTSAWDPVHVLVVQGTSNHEPVPVIAFDPPDPGVGQTVILDGTGSYDPDPGDMVVGYRWSVVGPGGGDPQRIEGGSRVRFVPLEQGVYAVSLTVVDSFGAFGTVVESLTVGRCEPGEEVCNGLDDDCDGQTDEDLTPPPADLREGVCAAAVKVCGGESGWVEPDYSTIPGYEAREATCDGLDNDCDGRTDEPDDMEPPLAAVQAGVCRGSTKVCGGESGWVEPDYGDLADYEAREVTCDGLDNDCDGRTDEDLTPPPAGLGDGVCEGSVKVCAGRGGWVEPDYSTIPGYEAREVSCDGLDNDCDGRVDDPDQDGDGVSDCEQCSLALFPDMGQVCETRWGCTPGTLTCHMDPDEGPVLLCEPALHLVDDLACGDYSREGYATFMASEGMGLAIANPDQPRRQYDPILGTRVLFMEGERTNLVESSTDLSANPPWRRYLANGDPITFEPAQFLAPEGSNVDLVGFAKPNQSLYQPGLVPMAGRTLTLSSYLRSEEGEVPIRLEIHRHQVLGTFTVHPGAWQRIWGTESWPEGFDGGRGGPLLRWRGAHGDPSAVAIWGVQLEEGPFPSSFIPPDGQGGAVTRGEDLVTYPSDMVGDHEGTLALWFRPLYPDGVSGIPVARIDGLLTCTWDSGDLLCDVGTHLVRANPGEGSGWIFMGLSWTSRIITLVAGRDEVDTAVSLGEFELPSPDGDRAINPLPLFAHSRDVRVYHRALPLEELTGLYDDEREGYR